MKKKKKEIINVLIILSSIILNYLLIYHQKSINLIFISILITYISILYFISTNNQKSTIKEELKNGKVFYIIKISITSIILLYLFPNFILLIPQKEEKKIYIHGKNIEEKKLYTIEKSGFNPNNYIINQELQKDAKKGEYKILFNKDQIATGNINIHSNNLAYLRFHAEKKPTVYANSLEINNYKINSIGIKTKGESTLIPIINSNNNLFSYTIKFKEYIKKKEGYQENQNLLGLNKISFNNMLGDPSKMKEYLSYYLFTEMGIPTPEYSHINLYINHQNQGLYFMLEPIDKSLTKRTMKEKNDFLIKPKRYGGDLLYDKNLEQYRNEEGKFNFDSLFYNEEGKIQLPKQNIMNNYNGIWENDIETLKDIYEDLPTFFETLKELNELSNMDNKNTQEYEDRLNKIIDVDALIKYWATNIYIVNTDNYISQTIQNYALYMTKEGRITIIPWDYNYAFGGTHFKKTNEVINYDIYHPMIHCKQEERPLVNVILGNDHYREKYETYLKDLTIIAFKGGTTSNNHTYPKNNLETIINNKKKEIIEIEKRNPQAFYTTEQIETAQENLKKVIKLRSESVIKQLNHEESNIQTDILLKTIGGYPTITKEEWNKMQ